jgi:hypothetical protein
MADRCHPVKPTAKRRKRKLGLRFRPSLMMQQPKRTIGRKIGCAWPMQQEGASVRQHSRKPDEMRRALLQVAMYPRRHILAGQRKPEGLALGHESRRNLFPDGVGDDAERGREDCLVRPPGERQDDTFAAIWIEARLGMQTLDLSQDKLRVAVDVSADLHDRRAPVAARERKQVRLGQGGRDRDGAPGEALQSEGEPDAFGERRGRIVVQDDVVLGRLCCGSLQLAQPVKPDRLSPEKRTTVRPSGRP